jgi:hypothetical protein
MTKNKFQIHFLPINHMLIGFSYQEGTSGDNESEQVEEFSIGFGLISFSLYRIHKV